MSDNKVFADGFIAKRRDNAPEFVVASLSVKLEEAIPFLRANDRDGWVNLDIKRSKAGKLYVELDTWRPTQGEAAKSGMEQARQAVEPTGGMVDDDIPFAPLDKGLLA